MKIYQSQYGLLLPLMIALIKRHLLYMHLDIVNKTMS